jgi:hypothetical protein
MTSRPPASGGARSPSAWSPWQRAQPRACEEKASLPAACWLIPRASATCSSDAPRGLRHLPTAVDPDPVLVGHAPAQVALDRNPYNNEHGEYWDDHRPVILAAPPAAAPPVDGGQHRQDRDGDPEPEVRVAQTEVLAAQRRLGLAPDEQARRAGGGDAGHGRTQRPRLGTHHRRSPAPRTAQEVQEREERDRDDREMGGGAVQLGEVRHGRQHPEGRVKKRQRRGFAEPLPSGGRALAMRRAHWPP